MLNVISLILGGALLVAGRKLFWLFVGAAGFVTGIQLATRFWQGSEVLAIIVGLVIGVIFALLAIFLQAIIIGIAGFLSGGYVLTVLVTMLGVDVTGPMTWIVYITGGILGVILVSVLFDWALITLSSMARQWSSRLFPHKAQQEDYCSLFSLLRGSLSREPSCGVKRRLSLPTSLQFQLIPSRKTDISRSVQFA
jgi:hypothetical protein